MWRRRLASGLLRLMACLPLPVVHGLAVLIGWLFWLIPNNQRRIAAINLALCFPDWDIPRRNRLLRKSLLETCKTLLELGPLWLWQGKRILSLVREVRGEEALRVALQQGRGAILITPHLGSWEIGGLYTSSRFSMATMYRPSRLGIDEIICRGRERLGAQLVPATARGVRTLAEALRAGKLVAILPDQDPGRESGLFVPFFGRPTNTMTLVSRLAIKSRAPAFLGYGERLSWGRGYRVCYEPLPAAVSEGPLESSVAALNTAVERVVRRLPEQYLWVYKRFKTRPPGEPRLY